MLGEGPDGVAKTPQWAARITGCPSARIASFARELAGARRAFIMQGWGPQRTALGEQSARAICLLSLLTGNFGLPGTNSGARERLFRPVLPDDPVGENPVDVAIPAFLWSRAVERGRALTASDGVRGAARLPSPVKLIINHAGNALTNQHADVNRTHEILADESLCEFIVGIDVMMTDSMRYADIVLPDVAQAERDVLVSSGNSDGVRGVIVAASWGGNAFDRRCAWDVARDLARRLGVEEAFCEGASTLGEMDGLRLRESRFAHDDEALRELAERGIVRRPYEGRDGGLCRFPTRSGGVPLAHALGEDRDIRPKDRGALGGRPGSSRKLDSRRISPRPRAPEAALVGPYPFQMISCHGRQSAHSSFANVPELAVVAPRAPVGESRRCRTTSACLGRLGGRRKRSGRPRMPSAGDAAHHAGRGSAAGGRVARCGHVGGSSRLGRLRQHGLLRRADGVVAAASPHNSCLVRLRPLTDAERAEAARREAAGRGEVAR